MYEKVAFYAIYFLKVRNDNSFWNWIDNTFLPSVYGESWYNGKEVEEKGFLDGHVTYLMGSPMIRQVRVVPGILSNIYLF